MSEIRLEDLKELIKMKNKSPEEYKKFLEDMTGVYRDLLIVMKTIIE